MEAPLLGHCRMADDFIGANAHTLQEIFITAFAAILIIW